MQTETCNNSNWNMQQSKLKHATTLTSKVLMLVHTKKWWLNWIYHLRGLTCYHFLWRSSSLIFAHIYGTWHAPFLLALDAVTDAQNLVEDVSVWQCDFANQKINYSHSWLTNPDRKENKSNSPTHNMIDGCANGTFVTYEHWQQLATYVRRWMHGADR